MKKLVVAEKPSVAVTIANAIGVPVSGDQNRKGYFENENYIVTFCYGHLIDLADPESYGDRFKIWSRDNLPIFPQKWNYKLGKDCVEQFSVIKKLMFRDDVVSLVCATDAGREGESIFRMVYFYAGCTKPFERLWVSSMEESAIRGGFANLQPSYLYDGLYKAAIARLRADWLVGMNCTRFYTSEAWKGKGSLSVGRVQTPTLNMIVERQAAIDNFKVTKQWAVKKDFGSYDLETENFTEDYAVQKCFAATNNSPVTISSIDVKPNKKEGAPKLYDLTALQKDANKKYQMSAQDTLNNLQNLYERKFVTYPRTDSPYITDADVLATRTLMKNLSKVLCPSVVVPEDINRLVGKVTDHGALLITPTFLQNLRTAELSTYERNLIRLIMCRMLCSVSPARIYDETKVVATCNGYVFSGSGTKDIDSGWKAVERYLLGKEENKGEKKKNVFPEDLTQGKILYSNSTEIVNRDTKPLKPYTEGELLAAMEKAGKDDFSDDVERKGLGTAATRSAIIEALLSRGLIERRKGKTEKSVERLYPLEKGKFLISIVDPSLKSVALTAAWEERLSHIRDGKEDFGQFCSDIRSDIMRVLDTEVDKVAGEEEQADSKNGVSGKFSDQKVIGVCPYCGHEMVVTAKSYKCFGCGAVLLKNSPLFDGGKKPTESQIKKMLKGDVVEIELFSKKKQKTYKASLTIDNQKKGESNFINYRFVDRQAGEYGRNDGGQT